MSVLAYIENNEGKFKKTAFELASYSFALAKLTGSKAYAMTIGNINNEELKKLELYGIEKVLVIKNDALLNLDNKVFSELTAKVAEKLNSLYLIFAHNNSGKALAPSMSVRLKAGFVSGVNGLPVSINPFIVKKKVYTSKSLADIEIKTQVKIITLAQNSFGIIENPVNIEIENFTFEVSADKFKTKVTNTNKITDKILLTDAEIVVSGGRGLKGPENWKIIEDLAEVLGAATACSRPVSDEGWRPHHEHVGQTGKIIAPTLYFACGISGAIQHIGGIGSSKYIVAINKDKDAPIFEAANYGIVGDVNKILPELTKLIKELKG